MHELSLMMSIIDIALEEAEKAEARKINEIHLKIGDRAGVEIEALRFAFETVTRNTIAEEAELSITSVPFRGECLTCGHQFENLDFLICDRCGGIGRMISGQELLITSLDIE